MRASFDTISPVVLEDDRLTEKDAELLLSRLFEKYQPKKVLLLPPDATRLYSGAGMLTRIAWKLLFGKAEVLVMPALGTHAPMTQAERHSFFGTEIPESAYVVHNWRTDVVKVGEVPAEFVTEVSEGLVTNKIDVEVNKLLLDPSFDLILSMGQVVPHEVVGMANYTKNILVGCGGRNMINSSHMLGAFYGMERIMGRADTPVRAVFHYAEEHFLRQIPLVYLLTVTTQEGDAARIRGLYLGRSRGLFERAAKRSSLFNFIRVKKPLDTAVVFLDPREFKSTWLGNKAIYRTRLAMADGGTLYVLAPGVCRFGEDDENDRLIRKYGYFGRENVLKQVKAPENEDLRNNLSAAAHLIHGSSDGRFRIVYCTDPSLLSKEEVESVGFGWMDIAEATARFAPGTLNEGENGALYYISNPALGLWAADK